MQRERQAPISGLDVQRIRKLQRSLSGDLRRPRPNHVQNGVLTGFDQCGMAAANQREMVGRLVGIDPYGHLSTMGGNGEQEKRPTEMKPVRHVVRLSACYN